MEVDVGRPIASYTRASRRASGVEESARRAVARRCTSVTPSVAEATNPPSSRRNVRPSTSSRTASATPCVSYARVFLYVFSLVTTAFRGSETQEDTLVSLRDACQQRTLRFFSSVRLARFVLFVVGIFGWRERSAIALKFVVRQRRVRPSVETASVER